MSAFKATEAVEPLDFNLEPHGPTGTIPEPSREELEAFREKNRAIDKEMGLDLDAIAAIDDPEKAMETYGRMLDAIPEAKRKKATHKRIEVIAELCGDALTQEQVEKLPIRIQEAFFGWLTASFRPPTSQNGTGE